MMLECVFHSQVFTSTSQMAPKLRLRHFLLLALTVLKAMAMLKKFIIVVKTYRTQQHNTKIMIDLAKQGSEIVDR
jgi:hypothetical protein